MNCNLDDLRRLNFSKLPAGGCRSAVKAEGNSGFKLEKLFRMCRKERRGAAVVEFAFVAPVFFLLVFGMIDIGRRVMVQQIITNATREGARLGVLDDASGNSGTTVKNKVVELLHGGGIPNASVSDVTVDPANPGDPNYNGPVTVTVTIALNKVSWLASPIIIPGPTHLEAKTTMRRESVPQ